VENLVEAGGELGVPITDEKATTGKLPAHHHLGLGRVVSLDTCSERPLGLPPSQLTR
jgi:hypothetical protein